MHLMDFYFVIHRHYLLCFFVCSLNVIGSLVYAICMVCAWDWIYLIKYAKPDSGKRVKLYYAIPAIKYS